jgi:hypothetical protein
VAILRLIHFEYYCVHADYIWGGKVVKELNFSRFTVDDDESQDEWLCAATVQQPESTT